MANEDIVQIQDVAAAVFTAVGGTLSVKKARGCVIARSGAGVYTLTLDPNGECPNLPADEAIFTAQVRGTATTILVRVENTSDSVKTIRAFAVDGTTATDTDLTVKASRLLG